MRDHRNLRAFVVADQLALSVYESTRDFPRKEDSGLTSQMRRSAVSVASNIVEGAARHSKEDYIWFLDVAYGSSKEVEYQISLASRLGLLDEECARRLSDKAAETARVLNALLRALRK